MGFINFYMFLLLLVEQEFLFAQKPDQPEDAHLLKVSILGKPNAGKSTLVNRLMKRRVSILRFKMSNGNLKFYLKILKRSVLRQEKLTQLEAI